MRVPSILSALALVCAAAACGGGTTAPQTGYPGGPYQPPGGTNPGGADPGATNPGGTPEVPAPAAPAPGTTPLGVPTPPPAGGTWVQAASPTTTLLRRIWSAGPSATWAVGNLGTILQLQGNSWTQVEKYGTADWILSGIWGSSPTDIWAVGGRPGTCKMTHYDGTTWTVVDPCPAHAELYGVWGTARDDVWAVGANGTILHFDGQAWQSVQSPVQVSLRAVWGTGPQQIYAVGSDGVILEYDGSWTQVSSPTDKGLKSVQGTAAGEIYAVGYGVSDKAGTVVLRRTGSSWQEVTGPSGILDSYANGVTVAGNQAWVVGGAGTLAHFDGTTWLQDVTPATDALHDIAVVGSQMWAVGNNGTILRYGGQP